MLIRFLKHILVDTYRHIRGGYYGIKATLVETVIPHIPSKNLRNRLIRLFGVRATDNVMFWPGFSIRNPQGLIIEDGVSIGPKCLLDARKGLIIHRNAVIAYEAIIWSLNHDYNDVHFCGKGAPTEIGAYAWICSRSIILPGVKIGEGAVVASGAIVTKDVAPYTVVGGIPAKVIGQRNKKRYEYGYKSGKGYTHFY